MDLKIIWEVPEANIRLRTKAVVAQTIARKFWKEQKQQICMAGMAVSFLMMMLGI